MSDCSIIDGDPENDVKQQAGSPCLGLPDPNHPEVELFINCCDGELSLIFRGREGKLQFVIK